MSSFYAIFPKWQCFRKPKPGDLSLSLMLFMTTGYASDFQTLQPNWWGLIFTDLFLQEIPQVCLLAGYWHYSEIIVTWTQFKGTLWTTGLCGPPFLTLFNYLHKTACLTNQRLFPYADREDFGKSGKGAHACKGPWGWEKFSLAQVLPIFFSIDGVASELIIGR